jgi:hypothetical protein
MEVAGRLHRVCQSWWNQLAESPKTEPETYAREFLGLLEWASPKAIDTASSPVPTTSFLLESRNEAVIAAHFTMPRTLEPPSAVTERGLDYCRTTRLLANATRRLNARFCLVTDFARFYFYDVQTDELLLHADSVDGFTRELAPVVMQSAVERGAIQELRRSPRSTTARQLRQWCSHWADTLTQRCSEHEEHAFLVLDRLFILRALYDRDIMRAQSWRLRPRYAEVVELAFGPDHQQASKALGALFHDLWFEWNMRIFRPIPALDKALDESGIAPALLREFTLLSKAKFALPICLESFNFGDPMEKARVRIVPENDEERDTFVGRQTPQTIDFAQLCVDVLDDGYRAILYWFDRLVETHERIGIEWQAREEGDDAPGSSLTEDLDLFSWSEAERETREQMPDLCRRIVEQGMAVYYTSARQYRTARLLLYLYAIQYYAHTDKVFVQFPHVESALQPRPKHLDSAKKFIQHVPETRPAAV